MRADKHLLKEFEQSLKSKAKILEAYRNKFARMDADGDGKISKKEAEAMFNKIIDNRMDIVIR